MKIFLPLLSLFLLVSCTKEGEDTSSTEQGDTGSGATVTFTEPDAQEVPENRTPTSDTDWEAKVHNKDGEIIGVLNVINPIAAYITAGFEQYGDQINNPTVHEEWTDTQEQLTKAMALYKSCNERRDSGAYDKKLFLDMENTWQMLVKTGVAGVRTQQMLNEQLAKL